MIMKYKNINKNTINKNNENNAIHKNTTKNTLLICVVAVTLLLMAQGALGAVEELDIVDSSINVSVNGMPVTGSPLVSPGDRVLVGFDIDNTYMRTLGHIEARLTEEGSSQIDDLPQTHGCSADADAVDCDDGTWTLTPAGSPRPDNFTFTVPFDIAGSVTSFTVEISLSYDNEWSDIAGEDFTDTENITFTIVREDHDVEIIDESVAISPVGTACDNVYELEFDIVNVGNRTFIPELLAHELEGGIFNRLRGEYRTYSGGTSPEIFINRALGSIAPGVGRTETITIDADELDEGSYTLFVYLVNPYFDEAGFFIGDFVDDDDVPRFNFSVVDCPVFGDDHLPEESSLTIREDGTVEFVLDFEGTEDLITWEVDGTVVAAGTGEYTLDGGDYEPGTTITVEAFVDVEGGETVEWEVAITNVPDSPGLAHNIPAEVSLEELRDFDLIVSNSFARLVFTEGVDLRDIADLSEAVIIENGLVAVDTDNFPGLAGREATITIFSAFTNPLILVSGEFVDLAAFDPDDFTECSDCVEIAPEGGFTFTVDEFSTFRVVDEQPASLQISAVELAGRVGETITANLTVTNGGTFERLTSVAAELVNVAGSYTAVLGPVDTALDPLESDTVDLRITVPASEDAGRHSIGSVRVTGRNEAGENISATVPIFLTTPSFLAIERVEIDGSISGDLLVDKPTEIEITIQNDYSEDVDDVTVEVTILDVDGEDIDQTEDLGTIRDGNDEKVTFSFDLRNERLDEDEYDIEIVVEGTADDDNNTEFRTVQTITVGVDRQRHQLIIKSTSLGSSQLQCVRQANLQAVIENVGEEDEEDIIVHVFNTALGLDLVKRNIDLDDYTSSRNEYRASFTLDLEDAEAGSYPFTVEVFRDNDDLEDTAEETITVVDCTTAETASQPSTTSTLGVAQRLQNLLAGRQAAPTGAVTSSFRDSDAYVTLLGVLALLVFIATVLALAVLLMKKR